MEAMDVALTFFRIAFAASVVVAALALAAATLNRLPRRVFYLVVLVLGGLAVAAWVAFGLRPSVSLAGAAGGLTTS